MNVTVNLDGSLNLEIIDDVETTLFNQLINLRLVLQPQLGLIFANFLFGNGQDTSRRIYFIGQIGVPRIVIYRMMATAQLCGGSTFNGDLW